MRQNHPLKRLARLCSIIGGVIMVALMLMTCYSVVGRNFFGRALIGDFELTAIACGIAVAFFIPLCQIERGNIIVDFFHCGPQPSVQLSLRPHWRCPDDRDFCLAGMAHYSCLHQSQREYGHFNAAWLSGLDCLGRYGDSLYIYCGHSLFSGN